MPKPLSPRKRAAILTDIKAARETGKLSARQIAISHGVSAASVTKIARDAGLSDAFERSQTAKATRAHEVDCKALRAQLKVDLMHDAQRLRTRIWGSHQTVISTPQGAEVITLDEAPLSEIRSGYTALGIAVDKSVRLEQYDTSDQGADHARSMLGRLFTGLAEAVGSDAPQEGSEPEES